jgi:hypothetical protein
LSALDDEFPGRRFTSSEVHALVRLLPASPVKAAMPAELADALYDGPLFARRLGPWFGDRADRRFGESQIHVKRARTAHNVQLWVVSNSMATMDSATVQ